MRTKAIYLSAVVVIGAAAIWLGYPRSHIAGRDTHSGPIGSASADAPQVARRVYPLSVIPGGVYSADELARARRVDSVVAAHYADFGTTVERGRLPHEAFMYVSYRRGAHVFWTTNKRRIPYGETVLSDGKNLARARCGNRLSDISRQPTAPGPQPTEATLNLPLLPPDVTPPRLPAFSPQFDVTPLPLAPQEASGSPFPAAPVAPSASPATPTSAAAWGPSVPGGGVPFGIVPGGGSTSTGGGGVGSGGNSGGTGTTGSSPTPVPEPATVCLFGLAGFALFFAHRLVVRRRLETVTAPSSSSRRPSYKRPRRRTSSTEK